MIDTEIALRKLVTLYQANLNDVIDCINTQKADTIILENIENEKYVFAVMTEDMLNFDTPFIIYSMEPVIPREAQADNFIKEIKTSIRVLFPDCGNAEREDEFFKLLRYQKALEKVIIKNPDVFGGYGKPLVTSLVPSAFEYSNKVFLNIGVEISLLITAR